MKRPEVSVVRDTENSFLSLPPRGGGACLWGRLSKRGATMTATTETLQRRRGKKGWRWIITDEWGPKGRRGRRRRSPPVFLHAGVTKWLATAKRTDEAHKKSCKSSSSSSSTSFSCSAEREKGGEAAGFACSEKGEGRNFRYATLSTLPR